MLYDAIIIGGGHNGLVTAAFLAKAGKKVLVLERRKVLGGAASTEEIFPGFMFDTGAHDASMLLTEVVDKLKLHEYGLEFIESPVSVFAPQPDGTSITLWRDIKKSQENIAKLSSMDAVNFPQFVELINRLSQVLGIIRTLTPPNLKKRNIAELWPWLKPSFQLKQLGKRDMMTFLRVLPMSVKQFLDEWFESEVLKGALGAASVTGTMQGPMASGTAFMLLYLNAGGFGTSKFVRGGIGGLSSALAKAAESYGAEIRLQADAIKILIEEYAAKGVGLTDGEELMAKAIISNADPRRTFFDLVGAPRLGPQFNRMVSNIRFRGCTAKMSLALEGLPKFKSLADDVAQLTGHIKICPNLEYLERAYDDAKYGSFSNKPYLDIVIPTVLDPSRAPDGKHIMSIIMQYAPYALKESSWDEQAEKLAQVILETVSEYAPNIRDLILHQQLLTPLDWQRDYGLTEGSIFHGQMALDQQLFMRPVPGWGQYRTPIENLYLCGAGTHPGGGVTGAPGYNAAREVLKDLKSK